MGFNLRGTTLARYGNPHHTQTLAGATLIFYHHRKAETAAKRSVWGWNPTDPGQISAPEVGRAEVAADGSFDAGLEGYQGGMLLVALEAHGFSYAPETGKSAFGLLGAASPAWQDDEEGAVAELTIDLPKVSYCEILEALDLWLVAGRIVDCETHGQPLIGGTVEAFDRDLTQDDFLGSATTDATGSFSIFFASATFKKIPSLPPPWDVIPPHELFGGPDVFFHVSQGTASLLEEPPSTGRTTGRENVPRCSFHELCVKAPTWTPDTVTLWSKIGKYRVPDSGSLHDFDPDGLTTSGKLAFAGNLDFIGQLSQTFLGQPTSFRFVFAEWPDMATAPSYPADYQPLTAANLNLSEPYGALFISTGPNPWDFTLQPVTPAPDAQGWIAVDQSSNFVRDTGVMVQVRTGTLVPAVGSLSDLEGLTDAGSPVPAGPLRDRPRKFSFVLEIQAGGFSAHQPVPVPIHINNSFAYLRYDLTELQSNACTSITESGGSITVHPVYTVAHPYLQYYTINVQRQGGTNLVVKNEQSTAHGVLWTSSTGEHGTEAAVYTDVGKCSYRTSIVCDRRLTNGYGGVGHQNILRTFCVD